ncbi:MAG: aminotransferase class V-fold PLP-dependent enzyme [Acidimicrobiales bacterium]
MIDVAQIRSQFPILARELDGRRLVYLDSAGSSQRPQVVLDAMDELYQDHYANVHRGVYRIAEEATNALESARARVARFIHAPSAQEVVFTKNATESLNLVAHSWGRTNLSAGDVVVLTELEHHSNIVPWQMLAAERELELRWIPATPDGELDLGDIERLLDGARVLALTAMSNVTGALPPVDRLVEMAHQAGAVVCLDACQYVPHVPTDVTRWGADFVAFSAHKMCGPTGIGVLWAPAETLEAMPPFLGGGGMILDVRHDGFLPDAPPARFEAGTPPIAEAVGLHAAIDYLDGIGMEAVREHEVELTGYAMRTLTERLGDQLIIHGPSEPAARGGVLSLTLEGVHPHDISQVLDQHAVCVRPGHHCAKPLMRALGVGATARASLYLYNDTDDVDSLSDALQEASDFFAL